jgi:hypothetical protein
MPDSSKLLSLYTHLPHTAVIERLNRPVFFWMCYLRGRRAIFLYIRMRHLADSSQIETHGPTSPMMIQGLP